VACTFGELSNPKKERKADFGSLSQVSMESRRRRLPATYNPKNQMNWEFFIAGFLAGVMTTIFILVLTK